MWERQKGEDGQLEPMLWFDRFTDFLHQDAPRSIARMVNEWRDAVGRPRAKDVPGSWRKQSLRWRWRDRAQAWDVEQRRLRDEQWASREVLRRTRNWDLSEALHEKVNQMLAFPVEQVTTTTGEDGQVTQIFNPADWAPKDVARYAEVAAKLAKEATGVDDDGQPTKVVITDEDGKEKPSGLPVTAEERQSIREFLDFLESRDADAPPTVEP